MENKCNSCASKSLAAQKLTEKELSEQSLSCLTVNFKKGDSIIKQGTFSTNIVFLKKGFVKLHMQGPYHEQIVKIVKSPNYLGLPTTFGDKINQYSITSIDDSEICFIDIDVFRSLLRDNSEFINQIMIALCQSELEAFKRCVNRTQKQIRGKLADVLLDFADNIYHSHTFPLSLTQEDIGNLVDASRETVSRVITEFNNDEIIKTSSKSLEILNYNRLKLISLNG